MIFGLTESSGLTCVCVYRFNHVYRFLGIPFQDIEVLPPSSKL